MELSAAQNLAHSLMAEHGITPTWSFAFDNATSRMGLCTYATKRISVSRHFTQHASEAQVRNVILHEIAHALAGPRAKHGPAWKAVAIRLGATPRACAANPYKTRPEALDANVAAVADKPFYRVASTRYAGKRYRILTENDKSYKLVDEDGATLRCAKELVHPEGQQAPSLAQMRADAAAAALASAKGKPVVELAHPGYRGQRFAIKSSGRANHLLVNLETGSLVRAPRSLVRAA